MCDHCWILLFRLDIDYFDNLFLNRDKRERKGKGEVSYEGHGFFPCNLLLIDFFLLNARFFSSGVLVSQNLRCEG